MYKYTFGLAIILIFISAVVRGQKHERPYKNLKTFSGNTHAHTLLTYSHGAHLQPTKDYSKVYRDKLVSTDSFYLNRPNKAILKDNWDSFQGLPEKHYQEAKKAGYDFYFVTDNSEEEAFFPNEKNNTAWTLATKQAEIDTGEKFSALMGVEHSEDNSYETKIHLNIIGPSSYINGLRPGVDIPYLYDWLKKNPINKHTGNPVVVQFNHPEKDQFEYFTYKDDDLIDVITLLEVINGEKIYYDGFIEALDKGWKVSPTAGLDNHNFTEIATAQSRTFVLSEKNTPKDLLLAMRNRRTYASLDKNVECRYTANDSLMGSTIKESKDYTLEIYISDPDIAFKGDKISKIDVVTGKGRIIRTIKPKRSKHRNQWSITLKNHQVDRYFFIRVWNDRINDQEEHHPIAWLAPVWIE